MANFEISKMTLIVVATSTTASSHIMGHIPHFIYRYFVTRADCSAMILRTNAVDTVDDHCNRSPSFNGSLKEVSNAQTPVDRLGSAISIRDPGNASKCTPVVVWMII